MFIGHAWKAPQMRFPARGELTDEAKSQNLKSWRWSFAVRADQSWMAERWSYTVIANGALPIVTFDSSQEAERFVARLRYEQEAEPGLRPQELIGM